MNRLALATIDTRALAHNLQVAKKAAAGAKVIAVIKADAYGHGARQAAQALQQADGFAVACIDEALSLRSTGNEKAILVFQGAQTISDFQQAEQNTLTLVVHNLQQLELLESAPRPWPEIWLKVDTGMGRMGIAVKDVETALTRLGSACNMLMSHLACADEPEAPLNKNQKETFETLLQKTGMSGSLLNSAGTLTFENQFDAVRPGIMLYGSSPVAKVSAHEFGLKPVMTLTAPLIAINQHKAGDSIGYGADYICQQDMLTGVIAIGYGDGYPRHAITGTPVLINGIQCPLIGRVSMDLLTVDLRLCPDAKSGDLATLWGKGLSVDIIAEMSSTIAYELLCSVGTSCERKYLISEPESGKQR